MKNLWHFLVRYNAFFGFLLFFTCAIILIVRNNNYQRTSFINSSNVVVGNYYKNVNSWKSYLALADNNIELLEENAALRKQLQAFRGIDSTEVDIVDSIDMDRYDFIVATVINNSIRQKSNYITLDKGSDEGIHPDMAVITSNGVVGVVQNVSAHFATVRSLLHPDIKISVTLDSLTEAFGSLVWGQNTDSRFAMVRDIPNHVKVNVGQPIFTSGYSIFPQGIKVGHVVEPDITSGESFKDIRILLTTEFAKLQHVYVVVEKLSEEKSALEALNIENEQ
jgi:rod shape-determining protein MreC